MIDLYIRGTPRPKPAPRFIKGQRPVAIAGALAKAWRKLVEAECKRVLRAGAKPISGAISLQGAYYFATTKAERWGLPHTMRPDIDNLTKLLQDSLKAFGILEGDDAAIAHNGLVKLWAEESAAVIHVRPFGVIVPTDTDDDLGACVLDGADLAHVG